MAAPLVKGRRTEISLPAPGDPFELVQETLETSAQVRLTGSGELDSGSLHELIAGFNRAASARAVVLDLSQVSFIDSAGMGALIVIQQEAERRGIELTVLRPPEPVTQLLEMAGVAERLKFVPEAEIVPRETMFLERVEHEFPADDGAPSKARQALRETIGPVADRSTLDTLVLMTSELVSNSVLYGQSGGEPVVGVRILRFPDEVRIEVDDGGPGFDPIQDLPPPKVLDPDEGGRGLFVVDRCSTRWGARRSETDRGRRFSVWFELDLEPVTAHSI